MAASGRNRFTRVISLVLVLFLATSLLMVLSDHASGEDGLIGYWKLDDGTATDSSGNNNHGTLIGGPTPTTGQIGGALNFDGVDDYINVPNSPSLDAGLGNNALKTSR